MPGVVVENIAARVADEVVNVLPIDLFVKNVDILSLSLRNFWYLLNKTLVLNYSLIVCINGPFIFELEIVKFFLICNFVSLLHICSGLFQLFCQNLCVIALWLLRELLVHQEFPDEVLGKVRVRCSWVQVSSANTWFKINICGNGSKWGFSDVMGRLRRLLICFTQRARHFFLWANRG